MEFFATCATGLEGVLGDELRALAVPGVRPLRGGVSFAGELADAYRVLLWSRVASRVLLTLARVGACDADALYEGAHGVSWQDHVAQGATLAVDAHGANDALHDTRFSALKVKDAICDALRERTGARPDIDTHAPDVRVNVSVHHERATLSIDLAGETLERRGYRPAGGVPGAPLRENVAAALLLAAGWGGARARGLRDAACGNGVLVTEAALMAADVAPGVLRQRWGFARWLGHERATWEALLDEADARAEAGLAGSVPIVAAEKDAACLAYARSCARRANVAGLIAFADAPAAPPTLASLGVCDGLLCGGVPGAPLLSVAQAPALFSQLGARCAEDAGVGTLAFACPAPAYELACFGQPTLRLETRNGPHDVVLAVYDAVQLREQMTCVDVGGCGIAVADAGAGQFAARLCKMARQRRAWAQREDVRAYRVYDADLPDYKLAIDMYEGAGPDEGKRRVHVSEYAAPKRIDPAKAARRFADALRIIPEALDVEPGDVFAKRRVRAKGGSQYARGQDACETGTLITAENGVLLEVDLASRLDTGLFLDHRDTRRMLAGIVRGKSFLNVFAYTGTASVQAAAAGAKFTTTLDISNTYLQWAQRNMRLNGLLDEHQEFVRADALRWVAETRHSKLRWDVVFADVPTFSNSAKMGARSFDVQRDHVEFLIDVSRLLTRGGVAVFSCNERRFAIDAEALAKAGVRVADITQKTIPADFARNPHVHRCYVLKRA